ncbi:hypothetical protein K438DRAFT_1995034 [Mycena galopus ATCC 62051]|nr:hypothetical protein K438DRAFT_1995034 [Mycena galopus ATCC 62051]
MQILSTVLALGLLFMSAVGAQSTPTPSPPFDIAPSAASGTATPISVTAFSEPYIPPSGGLSHGQVVAAAVGGSLGAAVLVLAGVFFLLRYRSRRGHKMMVIGLEGANNAELGRRCDQLESEVRALREQLDRVEARRVGGLPGYEGGAMLYTHEKDVAAFKEGGDVKDGKFRPPTYAD